jgi:hypothetical protein
MKHTMTEYLDFGAIHKFKIDQYQGRGMPTMYRAHVVIYDDVSIYCIGTFLSRKAAHDACREWRDGQTNRRNLRLLRDAPAHYCFTKEDFYVIPATYGRN